MEFTIMHKQVRVVLADYVRAVLDANPGCEIHVGCDSQNYHNHTIYVTALVFRFPGNGGHVIYRKERVNKINDLWTKLWGELERSIELAEFLRHNLRITVKQIELDYNSDQHFPSNKLLSAASGYVQSLGYEAKAKPDMLMAAWAADVLCH
jgi:predicted RNase H-related nuclease YkuK (DUF458 family)